MLKNTHFEKLKITDIDIYIYMICNIIETKDGVKDD